MQSTKSEALSVDVGTLRSTKASPLTADQWADQVLVDEQDDADFDKAAVWYATHLTLKHGEQNVG